jgi:hypothetical protein
VTTGFRSRRRSAIAARVATDDHVTGARVTAVARELGHHLSVSEAMVAEALSPDHLIRRPWRRTPGGPAPENHGQRHRAVAGTPRGPTRPKRSGHAGALSAADHRPAACARCRRRSVRRLTSAPGSRRGFDPRAQDSATLHACAKHPRGVNGSSASKISLIGPDTRLVQMRQEAIQQPACARVIGSVHA